MTRIVTTFVNPPIPVRDSDWQATFEGYDEGDPVGYGPTKQEAIDDLLAQALTDAYAEGRADERETWAPVLREMRRYLPLIEQIESSPTLWGMTAAPLGIATANGYRAAIVKIE